MIFRKGGLISKWLNIVDIHRSARHKVKFGCDVELVKLGSGNEPTIIKRVDPAYTTNTLPMVHIENLAGIKQKNGTYKKINGIGIREVIIEWL